MWRSRVAAGRAWLLTAWADGTRPGTTGGWGWRGTGTPRRGAAASTGLCRRDNGGRPAPRLTKRCGPFDDYAERGRRAGHRQQRDHDETDREHESRDVHARTSEAKSDSAQARWNAQVSKRAMNQRGQKTRMRSRRPV